MLAIVCQLNTGLTLKGLAKTSVHVPRGGTLQGVGGRSISGLFAVAAQDIRVVGLASHVVGIGSIGVAGRCSACWISLHMEFWALIGLVNLDTGLVLYGLLERRFV